MFDKARTALSWALALALLATDALALPRLPGGSAPAQNAAASQLRPGEWPQARSDIAADSSVRFGSLPNGMRYAIMRNATPAGQASFRLRFDVGSLMEEDAEQGLAHYLEHMAFNGSRNVPEGEMVRILERLGLSFGADTNASTGFNATTYKLDLPNTQEQTVDTALMLLRETASNLTISAEAVERERGVVLSEERTRDSPSYRVTKARLTFLMQGQRLPTRFPIGQVDVLRSVTRDQLAAFYTRYYRPERAVFVAVGDFDLDQMEARIRARFGDWQATGPAGRDPDLGQVARRGPQTRLVVEPGAPTLLQLSWARPPENRPDTRAARREAIVEALAMAVLTRRLSTIARQPDPPFIAAAAFQGDQLESMNLTTIAISARPDGWQGALARAELETRRAAQFGARQDELDREIAEARAGGQVAVAQANTRQTPALAEALVATLDEDDVFTSPAQDLALFEDVVRNLTIADVSAAMQRAFEGSGPLVFMSSPTAIEGGEQAVAAVFNEARRVAVTPPAALATVTWPYTSFGAPGRVVETREVLDLDTTFIRFANGVRLTVRPSRFRENQVLVKVRLGGGLRSLPADRQGMNWAGQAFTEGGLRQISAQDTEQVLASRVYGVSYGAEDDAFSLTGATQPDDLDVQLQVLAAYVSDPGWRPEGFQRVRTYVGTLLDQFEGTDRGVYGRDLAGLLHSGDRRWTFPTREDVGRVTLQDLQREIGPSLANGPLEVVIVGDISVERATELVAATFGALPQRADPPAPSAADGVRFPAAVAAPVVRTHNGRADQAIGFIAWPTGDFFSNPQRSRDVAMLGEVLGNRLTDELREAQGATYSPSTSYTASFVFSGYGYLGASVQMPPDRIAGFFSDVAGIAADLRDREISADELARAKNPTLETLQRARQTNEYWLNALSGAQADSRRLDAIRSVVGALERVSPADIRRAAQQFLRDDTAWRFVVRPAATTAATPPAPAALGNTPATPTAAETR